MQMKKTAKSGKEKEERLHPDRTFDRYRHYWYFGFDRFGQPQQRPDESPGGRLQVSGLVSASGSHYGL